MSAVAQQSSASPAAAAAAPAPAATSEQPVASATQQQQPGQQNPPEYTSSSVHLYVGDLHPDVNEAQLYEVFNAIGPVSSIRVCRDSQTRRSLGYAYVNYHNHTDAERGLEDLNGMAIKGKPCRVMWSQRDPQVRRSNVGNIFIKNLDKNITNRDLFDTFLAFGDILSCKVVTDEKGSKGYGFVHFETKEEADAAIATVNGKLISGKQVYVGPFVPRKQRLGADGKGIKFNNVFVKNLSEDVTEEELEKMFAEFGEILNVKLMVSDASAPSPPEGEGEGEEEEKEGAGAETGPKSRGFGFVCFVNPEDAEKAVEAMNGKEVKGKSLFVGRAQKKAEREAELRAKREQIKAERQSKYQGVNLYIKNLDDSVDDDRLREEFAKFGTITSAKVMTDPKGVSKGFGFVCFSDASEATKAVTEMNGRIIEKKPLYVGLAERRDVRKNKLDAQHAQRLQGAGAMRGGAGMPGGMVPPGGAGGLYGGPAAPMYFGGPGMAPHRQPFMYQMPGAVRPRWGNVPAGSVGPQPNGGRFFMQGGAMGGGIQGNMGQGGRGGGRGGQNMRGAGLQGHMAGGQGSVPGGRRGDRPGGAAFKYTTNVRNSGVQGQGPSGPAGVPQAAAGRGGAVNPGVAEGELPSLTSLLADANPKQQKQMLGERLFPRVNEIQPELVGKITGMLLEMDNSELLHLLESPEALEAKVNEAYSVLKAHQAQQAQAAATAAPQE